MSVLEETRRRLRERQLAGDGRAGTWARSQARQKHWRFLKRIRLFVLTAFTIVLVLSIVVVLVVPSRFLQGLMVGVFLCTTVFAIATLTIQVTGTAVTGMGAAAEQWTASELRPLRKTGWKVINHFSLRPWDIDHVVIGSSGVFAIETKWSSSGWTVDRPDDRIQTALDQVKRNAKDLTFWKDFKSNGVTTVQPVLFLWGPPDPSKVKPKTVMFIDGVAVVYGLDAARRWRDEVLEAPATALLDPATIDRLWNVCHSQTQIRDRRDAEAESPLQSVTGLYWTGLGTGVAGIGSLLLSSEAMQLLNSLPLWGAVVVTATVISLLLGRRFRRARPFVAGGVVGLLASVIVFLVLVVSLS